MIGSIRQSGLSLVELMVALALGAFLILGAVNVLVSSKNSGQLESSLARLQENGRIALDLLASDLRLGGYVGCSGAPAIIATGVSWSPVQGYERLSGRWSPALPGNLSSLATLARVGSDVISVQYGLPASGAVSASVSSASTAVPLTNNTSCIQQNDRVVVFNCAAGAEMFKVTNAPTCGASATLLQFGAASNSPSQLNNAYVAGDSILTLVERTWYVADTQRRRTAANIPIYALYRRADSAAEEMIEGIEYMQISYGQLLATNNIRYVPASDANLNADQVVSVRVALLVQSFEPVLDSPDSSAYQMLDESIDSAGTPYLHNGDLTLRRVFKTTILLRNRAQSNRAQNS